MFDGALLVSLGFLERLGVLLFEPHPFDLLLEETEGAAASPGAKNNTWADLARIIREGTDFGSRDGRRSRRRRQAVDVAAFGGVSSESNRRRRAGAQGGPRTASPEAVAPSPDGHVRAMRRWASAGAGAECERDVSPRMQVRRSRGHVEDEAAHRADDRDAHSLSNRSRNHVTWVRAQAVLAACSRSSCIST